MYNILIAISHGKTLTIMTSDLLFPAYKIIIRLMVLNALQNKDMAISITNYLEDTYKYLGKRRTQKNINLPFFPPSVWSHCERVQGDRVRV